MEAHGHSARVQGSVIEFALLYAGAFKPGLWLSAQKFFGSPPNPGQGLAGFWVASILSLGSLCIAARRRH